jgi:hypothetical protein
MTTSAQGEHWPSVTVVMLSSQRPQITRDHLQDVLFQQYPGWIECLVVVEEGWDDSDLRSVAPMPSRSIRITHNTRSPGEGGALNTGALLATGKLLSFYTPRAEWALARLRHQVKPLVESPGAQSSLSGTEVSAHDVRRRWTPPRGRYLLASDVLPATGIVLDPSNALVARSVLTEIVGLFDESIPWPGAMYLEWLMRLVSTSPTVGFDQPLVRVSVEADAQPVAAAPRTPDDSLARRHAVVDLALLRAVRASPARP